MFRLSFQQLHIFQLKFSHMKKFIFGPMALLLASTAILFTNCSKHNEDDLSGTGNLTINFENRAGIEPFVFGKDFKNAAGETLNFSTFNYFVSNFVLVKADGSKYTVPKDSCYFLCKHENAASRSIVLKNVPAGDYTEARFIIGVDSLKSVSDISQRKGVLDPTGAAAGMYWVWNSGYIFVKVEGTSPQAPLNSATNERTFQYHTGLFGGKDSPTLNNIKNVVLKTTEAAEVRKGHESPEMHVYVDILEMFSSPVNISVAANPLSHAGPFSKTVANNYADMFTLHHVHNHN